MVTPDTIFLAGGLPRGVTKGNSGEPGKDLDVDGKTSISASRMASCSSPYVLAAVGLLREPWRRTDGELWASGLCGVCLVGCLS